MDSGVFIVLGMPRAGTTFLYHTLGLHPDIYMPYRKESMYFSVNYDKGESWYRSLYEGRANGQIGADVNPLYYIDELALDRILDFDPHIKVILSVRDPVEFALSQHGNIAAMGWDVPPVSQMIEGYQWQLSRDSSVNLKLTGGHMERRIGEILQKFGSNVLLYDFKYFQQQPLAVMQKIEAFLELSPHFDEDNFDNVKINASGRRNIRFLNSLLTNQGFLETLYHYLPNRLIRTGRSLFDRISVSRSSQSADTGASHPASELAAVRDGLASDTRFYEKLFSSEPVIIRDRPL